jgi:hypothetical protein
VPVFPGRQVVDALTVRLTFRDDLLAVDIAGHPCAFVILTEHRTIFEAEVQPLRFGQDSYAGMWSVHLVHRLEVEGFHSAWKGVGQFFVCAFEARR